MSGTEVRSKDLFAIAEWLTKHKPHIEGVERPWHDVYWAGNMFLAIDQASMSPPDKAREQIDSVRRCCDFAIEQHGYGNMSKDAVFEYMSFMIARIHPEAVICGLAERLRLAENSRDHLQYVIDTKQI